MNLLLDRYPRTLKRMKSLGLEYEVLSYSAVNALRLDLGLRKAEPSDRIYVTLEEIEEALTIEEGIT